MGPEPHGRILYVKKEGEMNTRQKRMVLRLANFVGRLKPRKLCMEAFCELRGSRNLDPRRCKSVACALGWATVVFPRTLKTSNGGTVVHIRSGKVDQGAGAEAFGIPLLDAKVLFGIGFPGYRTPKQVARGLRHYARTGQILE